VRHISHTTFTSNGIFARRVNRALLVAALPMTIAFGGQLATTSVASAAFAGDLTAWADPNPSVVLDGVTTVVQGCVLDSPNWAATLTITAPDGVTQVVTESVLASDPPDVNGCRWAYVDWTPETLGKYSVSVDIEFDDLTTNHTSYIQEVVPPADDNL
jgi:hypothetical protein